MLRLGIVDFDSSHCVEFTRRLNHCGISSEQWVDGARVVIGYPGNSRMSPERIAGHAAEVAACGVELVDDSTQVLGRVDGVLVLSVCGQDHLAAARPFLEAGVPAFVDKPFACSLADAAEMVRLASEHGALLWSSSGMRFAEEVLAFRSRRDVGALHGVVVHGPAKRHPDNPGLFHYGVHAVQMLYALLGPGCQSVTATGADGGECVTGRWHDGRIGTVRGLRSGSTAYGFVAFTDAGVIHQPVSTAFSYRNLCRQIVTGFETGCPPVAPADSLEVTRFILAALKSEPDGRPVPLEPDS
jgi:predicted dehydrogenase